MAFLLKITLVPIVVWLASLAGRRWGHGATGWISGLPLIAGPISVFLALGEGTRFAADAASYTLQTTIAAGLHCYVFAHAAQRVRWPAALVAGWLAFALSAAALGAAALPPVIAFGLVCLALGVMIATLPRTRSPSGPVDVPRAELGVRILAALALAAAVTLGASVLGPRLSGIVLGFPITGSVLPAFALALHGPPAAARLLAGFLSGLVAFAAFHVVIAAALPAVGIAAGYALAVAAALAVTGLVARLRGRPGRAVAETR